MNPVWLERGGIGVGAYFIARFVGKWRGGNKARVMLTTPLVDVALLEAVFHPRLKDGDDPDLLAEIRDTLAHLNRQTYAEEFWSLNTQLVALDKTLGPEQKATLRRVLLRLLTANDRWLQLVGAKTAAELDLKEALLPLRGLLEMGDTQRFSQSKAEYTNADAVDLRFRRVLEESLVTLSRESLAT